MTVCLKGGGGATILLYFETGTDRYCRLAGAVNRRGGGQYYISGAGGGGNTTLLGGGGNTTLLGLGFGKKLQVN